MEYYLSQHSKPREPINYKKKIYKKTFVYPVLKKTVYCKRIEYSQSPNNIKKISESNEEILQNTENQPRSNSILDKVKRDINKKIEDTELIDNITPPTLSINLHPKIERTPFIKKYTIDKPVKKILQLRPLRTPKSSCDFYTDEKIGNSYYKNNSPIFHISFNKNKSNNIFLNEEPYEKINTTYFSKNKNPLYIDEDQVVYGLEIRNSEENIDDRMSQNQLYGSGSSNENVKIPNLENENKNKTRLQSNSLEEADKIHDKYKKKIDQNISYNKVKKLSKRFTEIYDPEKNSKGLLIEKKTVIVPGAEDNLFNDRIKVLNKMGKLSTILLSQKNYSTKKFEEEDEFNDIIKKKQKTINEKEINIKVLNKRTFEKFRENSFDIKLRTSKSPKMKFKNIALAMLSSKGSNSENRIILRKMRLEKGGVVDLAQESIKKSNKKKIKIIKNTGIRNKYNSHPKYREIAAKIIQFWWKNIKEFYTKKLKYIIKIQSACRGRFVRKYMYDIIYLNYLYMSFCDKIEKVLKKNIQKVVFSSLFDKYKSKIKFMKNLILKLDKNDKIKKSKYFNKWLSKTKTSNKKKIALLYLLKIRADMRSQLCDIKRILEKWNYITKIINTSKNIENNQNIDVQELKKQNLRQIKGLLTIFDGSEKLIKKNAFVYSAPKIKKLLYKNIIQKHIDTNQEIKFVILKKTLKEIFKRNKKKLMLEFFEKIGFRSDESKSNNILSEKNLKYKLIDKDRKSNKKINKRKSDENENSSYKESDGTSEEIKSGIKEFFSGEEKELSDIYKSDDNKNKSKEEKKKTKITIIKNMKEDKNKTLSEENSENSNKDELNNNLNKKTKNKINKNERKKSENEKMSQEDVDSKISSSEEKSEEKQTKKHSKDKKHQSKNKEKNKTKDVKKSETNSDNSEINSENKQNIKEEDEEGNIVTHKNNENKIKKKKEINIIKNKQVDKNKISSEENSESSNKDELNNDLSKKTKNKINKKRKESEIEKMSQEDIDSKISSSEEKSEEKKTQKHSQDKKHKKNIKNKEKNKIKDVKKYETNSENSEVNSEDKKSINEENEEENIITDKNKDNKNKSKKEKKKKEINIIKNKKGDKNKTSSEENSVESNKEELNNNLNKKTKNKISKKRKESEIEKMSQEDVDSKVSSSEEKSEEKQTKKRSKDKKHQNKNKEKNKKKSETNSDNSEINSEDKENINEEENIITQKDKKTETKIHTKKNKNKNEKEEIIEKMDKNENEEQNNTQNIIENDENIKTNKKTTKQNKGKKRNDNYDNILSDENISDEIEQKKEEEDTEKNKSEKIYNKKQIKKEKKQDKNIQNNKNSENSDDVNEEIAEKKGEIKKYQKKAIHTSKDKNTENIEEIKSNISEKDENEKSEIEMRKDKQKNKENTKKIKTKGKNKNENNNEEENINEEIEENDENEKISEKIVKIKNKKDTKKENIKDNTNEEISSEQEENNEISDKKNKKEYDIKDNKISVQNIQKNKKETKEKNIKKTKKEKNKQNDDDNNIEENSESENEKEPNLIKSQKNKTIKKTKKNILKPNNEENVNDGNEVEEEYEEEKENESDTDDNIKTNKEKQKVHKRKIKINEENENIDEINEKTDSKDEEENTEKENDAKDNKKVKNKKTSKDSNKQKNEEISEEEENEIEENKTDKKTKKPKSKDINKNDVIDENNEITNEKEIHKTSKSKKKKKIDNSNKNISSEEEENNSIENIENENIPENKKNKIDKKRKLKKNKDTRQEEEIEEGEEETEEKIDDNEKKQKIIKQKNKNSKKTKKDNDENEELNDNEITEDNKEDLEKNNKQIKKKIIKNKKNKDNIDKEKEQSVEDEEEEEIENIENVYDKNIKNETKKIKHKKKVKEGNDNDNIEESEENQESNDTEKDKEQDNEIIQKNITNIKKIKKNIINEKDYDNKLENDKLITNKLDNYKLINNKVSNNKKYKNYEEDENDNNLKALNIPSENNKTFNKTILKYVLKNILTIYKKNLNNQLSHYFSIWKYHTKFSQSESNNVDNNLENLLSKKYSIKLLGILINNLYKKYLLKKFNIWRRKANIISNEDNTLKKSKVPFFFSDFIRNNIITKYAKNFINNLEEVSRIKALQKIIIKLSTKNLDSYNNILKSFFYRWILINNKKKMISSLLSLLLIKNDKENLMKVFNIWKYNTINNKNNKISKINLLLAIEKIKKVICKSFYDKLRNNNSKLLQAKGKLLVNLLEKKLKLGYSPKEFLLRIQLHNRIKKLNDILNKINNNNSKNLLLKYLLKWKELNSQIKQQKIKLIVYWIKRQNQKINKKKTEILKRLILNKQKQKFNIIRFPFLYWSKIANILKIKEKDVQAISDLKTLFNKLYKKRIINELKNIYKIGKKKKNNKNKIQTEIEIIRENKKNTLKLNNLNKIENTLKKFVLNKINIDNLNKLSCLKKWKIKTNLDKYKEENIINNYLKSLKSKKVVDIQYTTDKMKKINNFKALTKLINISISLKNKPLKKYFDLWKNETNNSIKKKKILKKIILSKIEKINFYLKYNLLKWLYKSHKMFLLDDYEPRNKNKILFSSKMEKIIVKNDINKNMLRKAFNSWKKFYFNDKREEKLLELLNTLESFEIKNNCKILNYVCLIKKILFCVNLHKKILFFNKLKKLVAKEKIIKYNTKNLIKNFKKSKDLTKINYIESIYKLQAYKSLNNLFNLLKNKIKSQNVPLIQDFYDLLKLKSNIDKNVSPNAISKNNTTKNNKYMYNKEIDVESIGNGSRNKNKYFNKNYNRNIQVIKSQGQYISTNENTDNFKQNDQLYKSDNLKKMKNNEEIEDKTNIYSCCKFMSCIEKIMNKYRKKTFYEIEKIFIQKKYGNSKENIEKYYKKKLYKYFKKITIKRLFYDSEKIRRIFEIEKLIKITKINKQISEDRWMRQIIRRWRFLTYTKILAKKKLKFLYKNLYNGYIESVKNIYNDNNLFEDQKESEKINQGMFIDVNYYNREREIYNKIKEKYILKPIEYDRVNQNAIINGRIVNDLLENSKNEEMPVNDKKISKLFSKNYKKDEY